ncbi:hypothetical protein SELMODRAFT_432058 [Selaginella moellendorffii]|uniref:Uncharacterized protein n=1 Tax=Selaginella moellendorffii TaxID=88036 RepID=D8TEU8_SELML|nr:hypothetical protein SELMODRAFT_432058 [Selaginella moellendorffii]
MLQGRKSLIRVVGKRQRSVSLQDAPPAQILACQVGRKTGSRCLPDTLQRLHHWTCAWISFYPVRSSLIESPFQAICDGGARKLVVGRVNWENEDLHTITGLSVIHMLLAEDQGGHSHNWWHLELCHLEGGPAENVLRIFDTRIWGDRERAERDTFAVSLNALEFLLCLQSNRFGDHITKLFVDKIASALYEYGSSNESAVSSLLGSKFSARELKVIGASNEQMRVFGHLWATASSNLMVM